MKVFDKNDRCPGIVYPCEWNYKVIGENIELMISSIEETVNGYKYDLTPSNISLRGNYFSLNLKVEVTNEIVRNLIYEKLQKAPSVKMII